jgi:predicted HicB family RNase H-like nuclease
MGYNHEIFRLLLFESLKGQRGTLSPADQQVLHNAKQHARGKSGMARDGHLHLRIMAELRAKLARLAAADKRTLSNYVEKLLEEHAASESKRPTE